eukprot:scaffold1669_cov108-Isochrysis_galbana.AAC.15
MPLLEDGLALAGPPPPPPDKDYARRPAARRHPKNERTCPSARAGNRGCEAFWLWRGLAVSLCHRRCAHTRS